MFQRFNLQQATHRDAAGAVDVSMEMSDTCVSSSSKQYTDEGQSGGREEKKRENEQLNNRGRAGVTLKPLSSKEIHKNQIIQNLWTNE